MDVSNGYFTVTDSATVLDSDLTSLNGVNVTLDGSGNWRRPSGPP